MRRHDGWGRMRRPRAWFAATPPGGPGSPSAPTTWGCLQWLDVAWMKGGESCLDEVSAPGSTVPGTEKPRWSVVWRNVPVAKARQRHEGVGLLVAPHGAPSPRMCEGRETSLPGASAKNTGDHAWLIENWLFEN